MADEPADPRRYVRQHGRGHGGPARGAGTGGPARLSNPERGIKMAAAVQVAEARADRLEAALRNWKPGAEVAFDGKDVRLLALTKLPRGVLLMADLMENARSEVVRVAAFSALRDTGLEPATLTPADGMTLSALVLGAVEAEKRLKAEAARTIEGGALTVPDGA